MKYEKIEIAAKAFEAAPDTDCEKQVMDLYFAIKDGGKAVDFADTKATQAYGETVEKICIAAGLTGRTATAFGNVAITAVSDAYIPF
jgi:hypothetical protein